MPSRRKTWSGNSTTFRIKMSWLMSSFTGPFLTATLAIWACNRLSYYSRSRISFSLMMSVFIVAPTGAQSKPSAICSIHTLRRPVWLWYYCPSPRRSWRATETSPCSYQSSNVSARNDWSTHMASDKSITTSWMTIVCGTWNNLNWQIVMLRPDIFVY